MCRKPCYARPNAQVPLGTDLNLLLVEHAQPLQVDHVGQALPEGQAVLADLPVQSVVGHQVDVRNPVCAGDRDILPAEF